MSLIVGLSKHFGERVALPICRRVRLFRDLAAYVDDRLGPYGYGVLKEQFIINGRQSRWSESVRRELVDRFEHVQRRVDIHSKPADALVMAEAVLSSTADGEMVECGCFAGGSTAKLSILASLLRKRLFVFDSFEGLPAATEHDAVDHHGRSTRTFTWQAGANRASFEQVTANVKAYGEISACTFTRGWFSDTLMPAHLPLRVSFAYTDVVLASSARECLRALWPLLPDGGVYFSRDVGFTKVLQALLDERLWREELQDFPPILFGAGYGVCDAAPYLGFMVKGRSVPPEYIDNLMIEKPIDEPPRNR